MVALGCSVTLLLFHLFDCVNTSPVPSSTPAPPLPLQISPPTPTILPSLPSSSVSILNPSNPGESAKSAQCPLVISPSRLVVRYEDPVTANCSVTEQGFFTLGWEVPLESPGCIIGRFLVWSVDSMTEWSIKAACFTLVETGGQCQRTLSLVVYKPPNEVLIGVRNHTGPMLAGHQYTLQCSVYAAAPAENLIVTFYKEQAILGQLRSNNTTKEPVTEVFNLDIYPDKDDDGLQYWCEAKLELGPEGPRHPPVVRSQNITASILFGPELACPAKLQVKEGEPLSCEVRGNPEPAVIWFRDGKEVALPRNSGRQHTGKYSILAKGTLEQRNFTVEVEVLPVSGRSCKNCNRHFLQAVLLIQATFWLYNPL
ncbi:hypothetical protein Q5P01_025547 [Channa striata]|uniref:Ig-like domain-containing protein n=1 Tax=Channa striata TaxID=64152 RepID=A0AA88ING5_CHASR|nr:hypothetical protein Q5P01_025547 [Channa striata]